MGNSAEFVRHFIFPLLFFHLLGSCGADDVCSDACDASSDICTGEDASSFFVSRSLPVCSPSGVGTFTFPTLFSGTDGPGYITVMANHYAGCVAGRREANIFSYTATKIAFTHPNVIFISSLKDTTSSGCASWANSYASSWSSSWVDDDAILSDIKPYYTLDSDFVLRDTFFTPPFPHPSYAIIGADGTLISKFVGPCCGYASYFSCSVDTALALNRTIHAKLEPAFQQLAALYGGVADCKLSAWSDWSDCTCADSSSSTGTRARSRSILQHALGGGQRCSSFATEQTDASCFCGPRVDCAYSAWSNWSTCSVDVEAAACSSDGGVAVGFQFRTRGIATEPSNNGTACRNSQRVGVRSCSSSSVSPSASACASAAAAQCVTALGRSSHANATAVATAADGLSSPRDVAFNPFPGRALGNFSDAAGRKFPGPSDIAAVDEAWVANGHDHSISIVTGLGTWQPGSGGGQVQVLTRRDRGYYHYMVNITALSFNMQASSTRAALGRDTVGYFATCQSDLNTYVQRKEPNYFMGPTLYDSSPHYRNLVRKDGQEVRDGDEAFFLHADMLHEAPRCNGIVHDPESVSAYGTAYWSLDGLNQHVVRLDFQQPHGPGQMDHSIANVRRYVSANFTGPKQGSGIHSGMAIFDPSDFGVNPSLAGGRLLFFASTGSGQVLWMDPDSGEPARTARREYPIFSSTLPSFVYEIWGCIDQGVFASGLAQPSGLALGPSSAPGSPLLYVGEHTTSDVLVFDVATGLVVARHSLRHSPTSPSALGSGLNGLAFAPASGRLYAAHSVLEALVFVTPGDAADCAAAAKPGFHVNLTLPSGLEAAIVDAAAAVAPRFGRPGSDPSDAAASCVVDSTVANSSLYTQVHSNSGYASGNRAVQNDTMFDASAVLLANRSDCGPTDPLNFDSLLLGGYFCHKCLPDACEAIGGTCSNVQWSGFTCDNEVMVAWKDGRFAVSGGGATSADGSSVVLIPGRTVRIVVEGSTIARAPTTQGYEPLFVATASGAALTNATAMGSMDYALPELSVLLATDRSEWPTSLSRRTSADTVIEDIVIFVQGINPPTPQPSPSPSHLPTTTPAPTRVPISAPTFIPTTDPTLAPSVSLMPTTEAHRTLMVSFTMTSGIRPSSKHHHTMIRQHLGVALGVDAFHVKEYTTTDKGTGGDNGQSTWITYFEIGSYHIDGLRRRLDGRRLDASSTVSSSISDSSFSSNVGGTLGGTVTMGGVNITTATRPPSLPPSRAPTARPTRAPTTRTPTTRAPSTKPTFHPTATDTVQVAVELSIVSSAAPTSDDQATLKTTIASELAVAESTIRNFVVVTSTVDTTSMRVRRRLLATTYKWAVSFSVVVSLRALNDDSVTSASAFESVVVAALDSGLEAALAGAGVEVSVEAVETSTPASDDDGGGDGESNSGASSAGVALIAGAAAGGGVLLIAAIAVLVRQRRDKNWSMHVMGELHGVSAGASIAPRPKQPEAKYTASAHVATTNDL